ncbi:Sphingosine kinase related enzyme [Candidatus Koribacter versatilis Ellin345]|uniref:Sphingosine kinase related enzyme n=1 Tax=Koribacter versatilis (strain Ellin345) TaxID=204669 RepID=Q1IM15_KORVE|nr:diacylglycerol kinase family protein [Candidatus Koribacter versatilis]ABF42085.1 Sphingosine kinase related enzyme [Candidatus Koribacter versatilis Ellin345]
MRVIALLGPRADEALVKKFDLPGVNIFTGNDMDPTDRPGAAIVLGGDGTLHRHLAPLVESRTPFLHVPLGGGNDIARSLGIHSVHDALNAWKKFVSAGTNVREIDAGTITHLKSELPDEPLQSDDAWTRELEASQLDPANHLAVLGPKIMESQLRHLIEQRQHLAALPSYFCGVAGVGFDSEANRRANNMTSWLRRHGGYTLAAARTLFSYKPARITVSLPAPKWAPTDDGWVAKIDEPALLCAVGNTSSYGGGMRLTAKAEMDDGELDVCFVRGVGPLTVLRFFRRVFSGTHLSLKYIEYLQTDRLRISTEKPMPIYADGEYVCETPVELTVVPRALRAIGP